MSQFTANTVKKSKREKEAEAAEAKRREEEEHAAKAYADFLDAFDAPSSSRTGGGGGFVRSAGAGGEAPQSYNPLAQPRANRPREDAEAAPSEPASSAPRPKGKRAMDSFLEEIKRDQADREERHKSRSAFETQRGSRDTGDPETTNVFVANLPPNITEDSLGHFFARQGPVGSVKIMWPRGDASTGVGADITSTRRSKSAGLSGFVQYMKRKDAESCVREMDGFDWGGSVLRVGWSKAVPLAPRALYVRERSKSPGREVRHRKRSRSYSRSPRHDSRRDNDRARDHDRHPRDRDRDRRRWSSSRSRSPDHHRNKHRHSRSPSRSRRRSDSRDRDRGGRQSPTRELDSPTREFIRSVADDCHNHGKEYEAQLREREKDNRKYAFMWKSSAPGYDYFKSLRAGSFKTAEFDDDGSQSVWSTDSAEESEKERTVRKETLGKLAKRKLEALIRKQTGRREDTARAMVFCIEHAHAAPQVADAIISSLLVDTTAVPRKVARLHLICDILHNSAITVHKAWKFRHEFQARLPAVFDHLSTIYHSFPAKMTSEIFKKQILSVVEVWEDWIVFPLDFTQELRLRLDGIDPVEVANAQAAQSAVQERTEVPSASSSKFKATSFQPAAPEAQAPAAEDLDGEAMEDLDGEPVDDDVDGAPLDQDPIDGEDLDGEALDGEDLDGAEMDGEALDGEPLDGDALEGDALDGDPIPNASANADKADSDVSMEMDSDTD
ncbi:hypothetical protein DL93DRAFT_2073611 [Clavulina sp. PMI_390]|nr:hypothetical protein DL93DRAFT_2073611 [Clavulina sp. PMI_390]